MILIKAPASNKFTSFECVVGNLNYKIRIFSVKVSNTNR